MFSPVQKNEMPRAEKIKNMIWGCVNSSLFRFTPPYFNNF